MLSFAQLILYSCGMEKIRITKGIGSGPTPLSAFDAALFEAGIGNYNLIHLSSVIPPNHEPVLEQVTDNDAVEHYGKRLYLVYAVAQTTESGAPIYAGLGWTMTDTEPKRGLFVEHTGVSTEDVQQQIEKTLTSMISYRKETYGKIQTAIVGTTCKDTPTCAIVAAVYQHEPWKMT